MSRCISLLPIKEKEWRLQIGYLTALEQPCACFFSVILFWSSVVLWYDRSLLCCFVASFFVPCCFVVVLFRHHAVLTCAVLSRAVLMSCFFNACHFLACCFVVRSFLMMPDALYGAYFYTFRHCSSPSLRLAHLNN